MEDWYHICDLKNEPKILTSQFRVRKNTETILALLSEYNIKATFFMLGCVAESDPELAPLIAAGGHEIASHGYSHRLVSDLSAKEFSTEIRYTGRLIEQQTGIRPVGFRAPRWSLSRQNTPWAFNILQQEGYLYDSSLNPLPGVGDANGPCAPFRLTTETGTLQELPPLVASSPVVNLPVGGGWGFRAFPQKILFNAIKRHNSMNWPAVIYIHPREVDPEGPRLKLSYLKSFTAYGTRRDASPRLRELFEKFRFTTMKDLATRCQTAY